MAVVAAGVHFPGNRRLVGKFVGLLDRQRVHVGAQADRLAGGALAAADDADHAGAAETGDDLVAAEGLELFGNRAGRAMYIEQQFRMGMQVPPPRGNFAM